MQQSTRLPPGSEGLYGPQQKQPQPPVLHTPSVSGPTTRRGNASSPLEWKQKHASLQETQDPAGRSLSAHRKEAGAPRVCLRPSACSRATQARPRLQVTMHVDTSNNTGNGSAGAPGSFTSSTGSQRSRFLYNHPDLL